MERESSGQEAQQPSDQITAPDRNLPVVGIGASSGGLQALQKLFAHMPAESGMAFVVILHLSPEHESYAASVIQHATTIPVTQVTATVSIAPNHIYVIPPNKSLSMIDGSLHLNDFDEPRGRRAPIDLFFRTLAEAQGRHATAIVLSGSGADGTSGAQRVKENGGIFLAQEPQEAEFDSMPRNAIATGLVDFVLPVAAMPASLIAYWQGAEALRLPALEWSREEVDAGALREIFALLRTRTGHDFSQYKRATLLRRIGRRLQVNMVSNIQAYLGILRSSTDEIQALLRDLLISVTNFFRDPPAWHAIEAALPALFIGRRADSQLRVWVAGCATGEEAYTVAMLLHERASLLEQPPIMQIFATDIDEEAISAARQGLYPDTIAADVTAERLQRFFMPEQGRYRIKKEIRDLVLFAPHNVLRDPPFSKLDLITCRNLLIYLNREVQEQILQLFHFVLRPEGLLLLGASESTDGVPNLFTAIDKSQRLFLRRTLPAATIPVPTLPLLGPPLRATRMVQTIADGSAHSFSELHSDLLAQYTPPSVIVNENYEIIHLSRGAGRFLQFTEGQPSYNLLKTVHPNLRIELRTALFAAVQSGSHPEIRRIRVEIDGSARLIDLIIQPIQQPDWARGYTLVIFNDMAAADDMEQSVVSDAEPMMRQLEEELQRTKEHLRATIEQYETAAEEYKAANEELQAINEELRAATEELETSKEELQSVNEELMTVNQELKHKVEEVSHSNNDLQNLMASTEIGTIFVDRELHIKRYTPSAQGLFNLIPADINRPLAHITHHLNYDQLGSDATRVLATLTKVEHEVSSREGHWYLARLLPYRTLEDKIDGVILTFVNITDRRLAEENVRVSEQRLRLLVESIQDYAILTLDHKYRIDSWNPAAEQMLGFSEAEALGQEIAITFTPEDRAGGEPEREIQVALAAGRAEDNRWHIRKDGSRFYAGGVIAPLADTMGNLRGFVKIMRDLTQQKLAEEQLQHAHDILEDRVEERTRELAGANQRMHVEVVEREHLEAARADLLRRLVTAQEEERRRIARELHDQFGQQISALRLGLTTLADPAQRDRIDEAVARLLRIAAQLDQDVDRLALELRPTSLDDLGLRVALQQHVEEWSARHDIVAEFQITGIERAPIAPEIEIVIYRVVQEALTNVLKHANAEQVSIILERRTDQIRVIIEDDGRGFDPEALHTSSEQRRLGLLGMQERVALVSGTVTIESTPGQGTSVFVYIPTPRKEDNDDQLETAHLPGR